MKVPAAGRSMAAEKRRMSLAWDEPEGRLTDDAPPEVFLRDFAVMRRDQRPTDRPDFLGHLVWSVQLVLARYSRHVCDVEGGSLWFVPIAADSDDPADARLWVFFTDWDRFSATDIASPTGASTATTPAVVGPVTLGISPDPVVAVTVVTTDGQRVNARVENNAWFVPTRDAPIDSTVLVEERPRGVTPMFRSR